ncbi:Het-C-domain-containing protein [Acephala macrosclerotiorum]|nr:Het-C-domain-containing protein [Acephala macrosclerotiorum]
MSHPSWNSGSLILIACLVLLVLPGKAAAFGAGNIPSIAQIEGLNFRHGDIEDMLKTIAFIKGHKWTSMMVKRVYFGNWLRDYSQAVDVGSLKGVNAPTIRILEFEVTEERLGVYRPEEHIDNPKDYADNKDAREFDPRLRGPVQQVELEIDMNTAMKNYIANESGGWATSAGYIKFSFARSIHFGRLYTSGRGNSRGKEADLCEALREDFGAHTNYTELALRELGYHEVFPHCGVATEINVREKRIYPLVTGTFGAVDFIHSVLGEATDHFTQSEVEEMDVALKGAEVLQNRADSQGGDSQRGLFRSGGGSDFISLLSQVPGMGGGLASTARDLKARSTQQEFENETTRADVNTTFAPPPGSHSAAPGATSSIPGMSPDFDPIKTAKQIYPILEFRDKVVRAINNTIAKIPGLESLIEKISETLTVFVLSLLAPFIRPIIEAVSKTLKDGSSTIVEASANQQFEPWNDPHCSNPTHSMLSKDHFSNKLNGVAGRVATTILQYAAPRILYAWENPGIPVDEVMTDILRAFHHPALRDESIEIHRNMFNTVRKWAEEQPDRSSLNHILSSESVKVGGNHKTIGEKGLGHSHGAFGGHGKTSGSIWSEIQSRDLMAMEGNDGYAATSYKTSSPAPPSPAPHHSPNFGYNNLAQRPGSSSYDRPSSSGGYLAPNPAPGSYHSGPPADQYGGYQQQPSYGGSQGGYGNAPPYPDQQQPPYGGGPPYPGGRRQGPPPGDPGYWPQGPPPPGGPGYGQQQPPFGGGYPGQQPPYGRQPPYGGGGYGY